MSGVNRALFYQKSAGLSCRRRRALALGAWVLLALLPVAAAELPAATDLSRDAASLQAQPRPVMLEFAARHCSYCDLLEREVLKPMMRNPQTRTQVLIRRIDLDSSTPLTDFHGLRVSPQAFAGRYDVDLTPTLVFVDGRGREIAPRLVGVYSLDFFGGFVDQRIEQGQATLDGRQP